MADIQYIFNSKLAAYLIWHGCKLLRLNDNLDDPNKKVFIFSNTDRLIQLMKTYKYIKG